MLFAGPNLSSWTAASCKAERILRDCTAEMNLPGRGGASTVGYFPLCRPLLQQRGAIQLHISCSQQHARLWCDILSIPLCQRFREVSYAYVRLELTSLSDLCTPCAFVYPPSAFVHMLVPPLILPNNSACLLRHRVFVVLFLLSIACVPVLVFRCATDNYWNTCSPHIFFLCPSRVILHWLFFSCAATEILKRLHLGKAALLLVFNKWGFHWGGRLELYKPNLGNWAWHHKHLTQFQYQSDLQS